jgi:hypothetical protein
MCTRYGRTQAKAQLMEPMVQYPTTCDMLACHILLERALNCKRLASSWLQIMMDSKAWGQITLAIHI